jgi:bifunctional DNA-binding transcriptional regulator/antitoxin component of YhaV-PrlF toxin-antitoxin module
MVRVSRKFQITIPSEKGDYVDVELDEREGMIIVRPYRRKRSTPRFGRG